MSTVIADGIDKVADNLDSRYHPSGALRRQLNKVFPTHWSFLLGEVAMYSFIVLLLTGVYLTLFFDPSMAHVTYEGVYQPLRGIQMSRAYETALNISFEVRGGLFVRQVHHWAALLFAASIARVRSNADSARACAAASCLRSMRWRCASARSSFSSRRVCRSTTIFSAASCCRCATLAPPAAPPALASMACWVRRLASSASRRACCSRTSRHLNCRRCSYASLRFCCTHSSWPLTEWRIHRTLGA